MGGESLYVYRDEDNIEESPLEKELLLINTDKINEQPRKDHNHRIPSCNWFRTRMGRRSNYE